MKKFFKLSLLIIWLAVIFMFSSQNGDMSQNLSDSFLARLGIALTPFMRYFIRKLAHFSEFFILYLLTYINIENSKRDWLSFIFCVLVAFSDEFHQLFIDGRASQLKDVLIDSSGSFSALLLLYLYKFMNGKH